MKRPLNYSQSQKIPFLLLFTEQMYRYLCDKEILRHMCKLISQAFMITEKKKETIK